MSASRHKSRHASSRDLARVQRTSPRRETFLRWSGPHLPAAGCFSPAFTFRRRRARRPTTPTEVPRFDLRQNDFSIHIVSAIFAKGLVHAFRANHFTIIFHIALGHAPRSESPFERRADTRAVEFAELADRLDRAPLGVDNEIGRASARE